MKRSQALIFSALLILGLGLAACAKGSGKEETHLKQALAVLPANTVEVYFTDWARIKETEGVPDLSSQDSFDLRFEFMRRAFIGNMTADPPVPARHAALAGFALNFFQEHAETWGWDSTDLVWEASGHMTQYPPFYVLQFPQDFDFAPLIAHLEERGFAPSQYQAATIYSHDMDPSQDWLRTTELGIVNTAVLEEEKMLIISSGLEGVQTILDAGQGEAKSLADNPANLAAIEGLGQVAAAFMALGSDACPASGDDFLSSLAGGQLSQEQLAQLEERFQQPEDLHRYDVLGVGYRYQDKELVGLILMHYPDEAAAKADLDPRQRMAQEGMSFQTMQPYSQAVFSLDEARVEENNLIFRVSPVNELPQRLFQMVLMRDMGFAVCP